MKKAILLFLSCLLLGNSGLAQRTVRTQDSIPVREGVIEENGIMADDKGEVFLEFIRNTRVVHSDSSTLFEGDILPPQRADIPADAPRARMRSLVTFELATDSFQDVAFVDKFDLMNYKIRLREQYANPDTFSRVGQVKLIMPVSAEIGIPALWEYVESDEYNPWHRRGGYTKDTNEDGIRLFISSVMGTGIYTIWDEDPAPDFLEVFPVVDIERAPESPYPSVLPSNSTEGLSSEESFLPAEGDSSEITNPTTAENQNQAEGFAPFPADFPTLPVAPSQEEEPANAFPEETALLPDLSQLKAQIISNDTRIIPAVEPLPRLAQESPAPALSDTAEDNEPSPQLLTDEPVQTLAANLPEGAELPVAGNEPNGRPSLLFPIIGLLSAALIGGSMALAWKKKY